MFLRLVDENKGDLKSLILDLRNNPGGILDGAVDISNLFLDDAGLLTHDDCAFMVLQCT
jgi:carboxyl-terminal processing protease